MTHFGLPLLVWYGLVPVAFVLLALYLFTQSELAAYLFILAPLSVASRLSAGPRSDFLKSIFSNMEFRLIRILENQIIALPFLIFLLYKWEWWSSAALFFLSVFIGLFEFKGFSVNAMKTPFGRWPYEFASGFRRGFIFIGLAYVVSGIAVWSDNFNLGLGSVLLVAAIAMSFFAKPDHDDYVWNHSISARGFLLHKIGVAALYHFCLSLIPMVVLIVFFLSNILWVLAFYGLGLVYLISVVLARYAAHPNEISIPQGIMLALCLMFPPFLIGVIPLFYSQSIKKLKPILDDKH